MAAKMIQLQNPLAWDSLKPQKETFQEGIFKSTQRFLFLEDSDSLAQIMPYTTYFLTGIISNFYRREWTLKSLDHISLFSCHAISIYHFFQGNFYSYVHYRRFKLYLKISRNYFWSQHFYKTLTFLHISERGGHNKA